MMMPPLSVLILFLLVSSCVCLHDDHVEAFHSSSAAGGAVRPSVVKREHRKSLMVTEYGEISAVDICSGRKGDYHLEFMTLEPNALFLPVVLHADMVFYVNSGSGKLTWADDGKHMKRVNIKRGDIYRLPEGSVFFVQSNLEPERHKLRIYAIYSNTDDHLYEPSIGAYSSISDLVLGFDRKLLQSAFKVSEDVVEEMKSATKPPAIVHAVPEEKKSILKELEDRFLNVIVGNEDGAFYDINGGKKKNKDKVFNILEADPDFQNCHGRSVTVGRDELKSLRGSNIGIFMVYLEKGSMMGPHWNPMAFELAIVIEGRGMVKVVCPSNANEAECKNMIFEVKEGDVFSVPKFHPMAQMSFNNGSFVFMGFSTSTKKNYPQFLAGESSVLQNVKEDILALSFNVTNTTIHEFLAHQEEAVILDCTSCAEEELIMMELQKEKERQEEEARKKEEERRKEEEARKKEEEEERRREEGEERKREEEEEKEREREEERRKEEKEEKKRQEEEKRREEEKEEKRREEEEEKREREEEKRREEEEEEKRREEEEEEAEREKKKARKQEEGRKEREQEEAEEQKRKRREEKGRKEKEAGKEREKGKRERRKQEDESRNEREKEEEEDGKEKEVDGGEGTKAPRKVWDWMF